MTSRKTHIGVSGHPDFHVEARFAPLEFTFGSEGSFALSTGDIDVRFEAIPITIAVPFLPRRVVAGSLGPFGVHIRPIDARLKAVDLNVHGTFGKEDSEARVHVAGEMKAEVEITGQFPDQAFDVAIRKKE